MLVSPSYQVLVPSGGLLAKVILIVHLWWLGLVDVGCLDCACYWPVLDCAYLFSWTEPLLEAVLFWRLSFVSCDAAWNWQCSDEPALWYQSVFFAGMFIGFFPLSSSFNFLLFESF